MAIEMLEETTARMNKKCKDILAILNDPIRLITEGDNINMIINELNLEIAIFGNFTEAFINAGKKEGEENE